MTTGSGTPLAEPPAFRREVIFMAQDALTGEWLHRDLPLSEAEWTLALDGDEMTATIDPPVGSVLGENGTPILEEWATLVYAVDGPTIQFGGIYTGGEFVGGKYSLNFVGFQGYLDGLHYLDKYVKVLVDPADVYRELWRHAQSYANGDLGVQVSDETTARRIGQPETETEVDFTTDDGERVQFTATEGEPYKLVWWDAQDMGQEVQQLADEAPFDLTEHHRFTDDARTRVAHKIDIHYPRAGRKRNDLTFRRGENVTNVVTIKRDGEDFANSLFFVGKGEGSKSIRAAVETNDGRLRRTQVVKDKTVNRQQRAKTLAHRHIKRYHAVPEIESVTVKNGAAMRLRRGDDILIETESPWLGKVGVWSRVLSITRRQDSFDVELTLARSDSFDYTRRQDADA